MYGTCAMITGKIKGMLLCSTGGSKLVILSWGMGVSSLKMAAHKSFSFFDPCCGSQATFFSSSISSEEILST